MELAFSVIAVNATIGTDKCRAGDRTNSIDTFDDSHVFCHRADPLTTFTALPNRWHCSTP